MAFIRSVAIMTALRELGLTVLAVVRGSASGKRPRSRIGMRPRFAGNFLTLPKEGAGNAGRSMRPQPGGQKGVDSHTSNSHHGHTGNTRHSPRNGFTVSFVLSPVIRIF
jgi:hypothetical protein